MHHGQPPCLSMKLGSHVSVTKIHKNAYKTVIEKNIPKHQTQQKAKPTLKSTECPAFRKETMHAQNGYILKKHVSYQ